MKSSERLRSPSCALSLVAVVGLLAIGGCDLLTPNHSPVVQSLSAPTHLMAGGNAVLACTASDEDGDGLSYNWSCDAGVLSPATGDTVSWFAPAVASYANVTVSVTDGRGGRATQSATISVDPQTWVLINWDDTVPEGLYTYWSPELQAGTTLSGNFSSDNNYITFLLLDGDNYGK